MRAAGVAARLPEHMACLLARPSHASQSYCRPPFMRLMRTIGCVHNEANGNCLCGRSRVHCAGWHCGAACTNLSAALDAYTDCKCHTSCACTIALGPRLAVSPLCDAYFARLAALGAYTDCKCHTSCACTIALGPRVAVLPLCYAYFARLAALGAYTDCKCHTSCACTNALGPRVAVLPLCYAYFDRLAVHGAYTDCNAIPPVRLNMNRIIFGWLRRGALTDRSSAPHARCRSGLTPPQNLCAT